MAKSAVFSAELRLLKARINSVEAVAAAADAAADAAAPPAAPATAPAAEDDNTSDSAEDELLWHDFRTRA